MGALNEASKTMLNIKETLVKLSSDSISANDRTTYSKDFENLVNRMNRALGDASYNGRSLLGSQDSNASAASTAVNTSVVRNESGATLDMTGRGLLDADLRHPRGDEGAGRGGHLHRADGLRPRRGPDRRRRPRHAG
jgi:flagellin-like hook-associated protein FlgL